MKNWFKSEDSLDIFYVLGSQAWASSIKTILFIINYLDLLLITISYLAISVTVFNEFESRPKSAKNRFQLSAGLILETINTILSGTNHLWAAV